MKYLGSVILIYAFVTLSGLLCTGLILGSFYCKKKLSQMNEEKWEAYFHSVSEVSYLIRFWIFFLGSAFGNNFGIQPVAAACGDQRVLLFDRDAGWVLYLYRFYQRFFSKIVYHDLGHHDAVLPAFSSCMLACKRAGSPFHGHHVGDPYGVFPDGVCRWLSLF